MNSFKSQLAISQANSWQMFNDISQVYDLLNRVLSLGLDTGWRRKLNLFISSSRPLSVLDIATGTADVLIGLVNENQNIERAYGIDLADKMLLKGQHKIDRLGLSQRIKLKNGDAQQVPFPDHHFDVVTMAFGIRNIENPITALKEMHRILKKEGRVLILEFSLPHNPFLKFFYLIYLRILVPFFGGLLSGHYQAYYYLNRTIERFPHGENFCRLMKQVGFKNTKTYPLTFGIATIYQGDKT